MKLAFVTTAYPPIVGGAEPDVVHFNDAGRELLGQAALHWARLHGTQFVSIPYTHRETWGDSRRVRSRRSLAELCIYSF